MTDHFLTPLLEEFTDRLNEAVRNAQAEILATLSGIAQPARSPRVSAGMVPGTDLIAPQKRTPDELARTTELVFNIIKSYPGQRIELLAEKCGLSTREMQLPLKRLRAEKRMTAKGSKRATTYTVAKARG